MNDIDLQIEQIESARVELKKHFGEYYELSALMHTVPLLEELKDLREYKDRAEWVIKTHEQIKADVIDEFRERLFNKLCRLTLSMQYFELFDDALQETVKELKEQKNDRSKEKS